MTIFNYQSAMNYEQKNQSLIRIFWVCVLAIFFLELLGFILYLTTGYAADTQNYFLIRVALPAAVNLLLGSALTLLNAKLGPHNAARMSGVIVFGCLLLSNSAVLFHYGISVVCMIYVIPVFSTLVYNSRKLTYFCFAVCLASYLLIAALYLPSRASYVYSNSYMDIASTVMIIGISLLIGLHILDMFGGLTDKIIDETIKKVTMERASKEDSLTKLYNHAVFYDYLDLAILSFKSSRTMFSIVVMDIDNFKNVNDTYGHAFGDQVLLKLVETIQSNLSTNDVAFRYGGEEFTLIAFSGLETTLALAERIREQFSLAEIDGKSGVRFTVSCGLSQYGDNHIGKREFFASADRALYIAKRTGKNRCVVASDEDIGCIIG